MNWLSKLITGSFSADDALGVIGDSTSLDSVYNTTLEELPAVVGDKLKQVLAQLQKVPPAIAEKFGNFDPKKLTVRDLISLKELEDINFDSLDSEAISGIREMIGGIL